MIYNLLKPYDQLKSVIIGLEQIVRIDRINIKRSYWKQNQQEP